MAFKKPGTAKRRRPRALHFAYLTVEGCSTARRPVFKAALFAGDVSQSGESGFASCALAAAQGRRSPEIG